MNFKTFSVVEFCSSFVNQDYCQLDEIAYSLDDIQREHPNVLRLALYWICRAKLAETVGDHEVVVCMVDQAFNFPAQVIIITSVLAGKVLMVIS